MTTEKMSQLTEGAAGYSTQDSDDANFVAQHSRWRAIQDRKLCLHCGGAMPWRRRWTTQSHFCCDEHRDIYHVEFASLQFVNLAAAVGTSSPQMARPEMETSTEPAESLLAGVGASR